MGVQLWKIVEKDDKGRWFTRTGSLTRRDALQLLERYVEQGKPRSHLRLERQR